MGGLWRRLAALYRGTALVGFTAVLILALIEAAALGLRALGLSPEAERYFTSSDRRAALPYYAAQAWGRTYWDEFAQIEARRMHYAPYTLWRRPPFAGETITIDAQGLRATPGADCRPEAFTVFVFGGSAVWGTGAPDWGTIPALLQMALAQARAEPVCVVNYGESGYVSKQDVIQFLLLLEAGTVPDVAIFYGGANDLLAAAQSGQPGLHQHAAAIAARLEAPLAAWLAERASVRLLRGLAPERAPSLREYGLGAPAPTLAEAVAQTWRANLQLAAALGAPYGVRVIGAWQPLIATGNRALTPQESAMRDELAALDLGTPAFVAAVLAAVQAIVAADPPGDPLLVSLAGAFDAVAEPVYIDAVHVTPEGNRVIAAALLALVEQE